MKRLTPLFFLAFAVACLSFSPTSGEYRVSTDSIVEDSCEIYGDDFQLPEESDPIEVTFDEQSGALTIAVVSDDGPVFDCALDGMDFTCDDIPVVTVNEVEVTRLWLMSGSFITETEIDPLLFGLSYDCIGAGCDAQFSVPLPCTTMFTATAALAN